MLFFYGTKENNVDVSNIVNMHFKYGKKIFIPTNDQYRASFFGDPVPGIPKNVFVHDNNGNSKKFGPTEEIQLTEDTLFKSIDDLNGFHFFYGSNEKKIFVSKLVATNFFDGDKVFIPKNDHVRASIFSDAHPGVSKNIFVFDKSGGVSEFGPDEEVILSVSGSLPKIEDLNGNTFYYGIPENRKNISNIVLRKCLLNSIVNIPKSDSARGELFGDPVENRLKSIFVEDKLGNSETYSSEEDVLLDVREARTKNPHDKYISSGIKNIQNVDQKLEKIHKLIQFNYGSMRDEYPEQTLIVNNIKGDEKILEIGTNIGRCSMIIATLINDQKNFVTMEFDEDAIKKCEHNKDINNFKFIIEKSALSKTKLEKKPFGVFHMTVPYHGNDLNNPNLISTIDFNDLQQKHNIQFDTLILDCEGAFYYILLDMPEVLDNINCVIIENDFQSIEHKHFVDDLMRKKGLKCVYTQTGGWGCCHHCFYEVWKR